MLNRVSATSHPRQSRRPAVRLTADDRRRQLVGIGLGKLTEKPLHQLSIDEVAAEAGISRGLLFHYFPTKTDFYRAVVEAAGRRVLRNTAGDPSLPPEEQLRGMLVGFVEQVARRRESYISFVRGASGGDLVVVEVYDRMREEMTQRVLTALSLEDTSRNVVHAWWAYVEDRVIEWSAQPAARRTASVDELTEHGLAALRSLLAL
jgi:AcrR family transcriptional regulator